jgi:branched-chain amino acid aminotransferase
MTTCIENRLIWLNGEILNVNDAKISILSPTSQFGLNVFEGIRCYWNADKKQLYAFRLEDHFKRLKRSIKLLQMEDTFSMEELTKAFKDVIVANEYDEDVAVRQTIFVDGFGSWISKSPIGMFIAPIPKARTNPEYNKQGLNCCISSWHRINENALSPRIKCGANYINSRMAQLEALKNGYDTAIILNKDGKVSEGPGSCLFMVKQGILVTPLLTDSVLESITRDTILYIAKNIFNWTVEERSIDRTELYTADEAFLCGSAMEITPIFSVDKYLVGDGLAGKMTTELHNKYLEVVTGVTVVKEDWIIPIY